VSFLHTKKEARFSALRFKFSSKIRVKLFICPKGKRFDPKNQRKMKKGGCGGGGEVRDHFLDEDLAKIKVFW